MKPIYNIGNSYKYGNVVAVSEKLTEVTKDEFYNEINKSIEVNLLQRYEKEAKLIKNLKHGVTLGDDYYIIKTNQNENRRYNGGQTQRKKGLDLRHKVRQLQ